MRGGKLALNACPGSTMHGLTVAFDLDGTLVDTAPDLIRATNHTLATIGLGPVPGDEIRAVVSYGARRMIERGLELHGAQRAAGRRRRHAGALPRLSMPTTSPSTAGPIPQLTETLARPGRRRRAAGRVHQQARGPVTTAARSARPGAPVRSDLRSRHVSRLQAPSRSSDADDRAGRRRSPRDAVMVGDSDTDLNTARAAGIPFIGVSFGYTAVPMRDLGPDVADRPLRRHSTQHSDALMPRG